MTEQRNKILVLLDNNCRRLNIFILQVFCVFHLLCYICDCSLTVVRALYGSRVVLNGQLLKKRISELFLLTDAICCTNSSCCYVCQTFHIFPKFNAVFSLAMDRMIYSNYIKFPNCYMHCILYYTSCKV